ncbi:4Fe-4S binding protein [Bacteroidota bacterium]
MHMQKILRHTGKVLLLVSFLSHFIIMNVGQYKLSENDLEEQGTENKHELLRKEADQMIGKTYNSQFSFMKDLTNHLDNVNKQISDNGFSNNEIKQICFNLTKSATVGVIVDNQHIWFFLTIGLLVLGALLYIFGEFGGLPAGIRNNGIFHFASTARGWIGILIGSFMIGFYIILYFYPEYITNWVILLDPVSKALNGNEASHWFLYGFLYTVAVLVMGIRMLLKYKGNSYQTLRTSSVMFFQLAFAFIIPEILASLNKPGYDFKNIWPLDYDFFYDYSINQLITSGTLGWFMLFWGIMLIIVAVPIMTYFFGKRWYCSWVCGCGGLAETLGDPFRQLSDKSLKAWKVERILIHAILIFAVLNTMGVLYTYFSGNQTLIGIPTDGMKVSYGFLISSMFAGVIGTGFYPLMGNRVWCRFGCPLAAYLGIVQRFKSRFRITTNGGQCISCGNCSTYCEMGIDVRWYAQRGQNIVRGSCVGCGICSAVCPRGVLKLESRDKTGRMREPVIIGNESIKQ